MNSDEWEPGDGKPPWAGNGNNPNKTPSSNNNPFNEEIFDNKVFESEK